MTDHTDRQNQPRNAMPAMSTEEVEAAFAAADRATVLRHRSLGIPLLVWQAGRMVEVDPWTIELPEEAPRARSDQPPSPAR